jgi:ATP-binding cassette subfamily B protein
LQSFSVSYFQTVVDSFSAGTLTYWSIAVYCIALMLMYVLNYANNYPWSTLESAIPLYLKISALKKLSTIDYLAYTKLGTGALIQRIETGALAGSSIFLGFFLRFALELLPSMAFSIFFVFAISPTVTAAILVGYVVVFIVSKVLLNVLYKVKDRILVNQERFNHFLVRGLMEMVVFRLFRRFPAEVRKAETTSGEIVAGHVKMQMVHEAFFTIFVLLVSLIKIGVIVYGWTSKSLSIGQVVALVALMDNAYQPIAIFNVLYVQYKLDKMAFARYTDFLDAKDEPRLLAGESVGELKGDIAFSDVVFAYEGRVLLHDFNLQIPSGRKIAFVGESGSGKSTVLKLLVGLLRPNAGRVLVDGHDVGRMNLNQYNEQILYLPQEASIFDGTLRENLVFDEAIDDQRLIEAFEQVELGGLFAKLEQGLDTPLGEKGVSLSGGERQQLALARLWFSKARIVFFDEATSAMDNLTEERAMKNALQVLGGKTVIAIAHRLDSIKAFDNLFVFQDGRIVERGNFDALMEQRSYFYELYSRRAANADPVP